MPLRVCIQPYTGTESSFLAQGPLQYLELLTVLCPGCSLPPSFLQSQSPRASLRNITQAAGNPQHPSGSAFQNLHPKFYAFFWIGTTTDITFSKGLMPPTHTKQNSNSSRDPEDLKSGAFLKKCIFFFFLTSKITHLLIGRKFPA